MYCELYRLVQQRAYFYDLLIMNCPLFFLKQGTLKSVGDILQLYSFDLCKLRFMNLKLCTVKNKQY